MTRANFDGEDPIKDAFEQAYIQLEMNKIDPHSADGRKILAAVISAVGQFYEKIPPLPGTEKLSGMALLALRVGLGINLPEEKK